MAEEIIVRKAKKDEGTGEAAKGEQAGPVKEAEVEGQAAWIYLICPWCGGMNRCLDTYMVEVWTCGWCGGRFRK